MKGSNSIRQRFVNLMYLLFLVMAFINLTEVSEVFTEVNRSLERSNYRLDQKNRASIATIQKFQRVDSLKYADVYNIMYEVKGIVDSATLYLEELKQEFILESGGIDAQTKHIKNPNSTEISTRLMVSEKDQQGLNTALRLREVLQDAKEELLERLDKENQTLLDTVLRLDNELMKANGVLTEWDNYYFSRKPPGAAVALFSKFQNDLKLAEALVMGTYYDKVEEGYNASFIGKEGISLDTILIDKGIRKFDVFNLGEDGVARITIPTVPGDATAETVVYTYNDQGEVIDSFLFNNGVGEVQIPTDQIGEFKIKGVVRFRYPDGSDDDVENLEQIDQPREEDFPFEIDYKVVNNKPFLSQAEYNILYIGVNNPLNTYHPEYDRDRYRVTISQGEIIDNGEDFMARPYRLGYAMVSLAVPDGEGGYKVVSEEKFQVRNLPQPEVVLYNREGGNMASKIFKQQKGLETYLKNLAIPARFKVTEFTVTYIGQEGLGIFREKVKGSYFTGKSRELIDLAKPGDIYLFEDISVKGPDGRNQPVESLVFNIN